MAKWWRVVVAGVVVAGAGCCHLCRCCDWKRDRPPARIDAGQVPPYPPPGDVAPPVGPRTGTGAYGGTGP